MTPRRERPAGRGAAQKDHELTPIYLGHGPPHVQCPRRVASKSLGQT
jgi:hypothetical protein